MADWLRLPSGQAVNMDDAEQKALMTPITLPLLAVRVTLAAAWMAGVNAGIARGHAAHGDMDACVDAYMDNLTRTAEDLGWRRRGP